MPDHQQPPQPRDRIGPYTLHGVIAHGGSGSVYRATSPEGQTLALKVLHARFHSASDFRRFEREAAIRIGHRNIVDVVDAGSDEEGNLFIALELLEGTPLSGRIGKKLLSPREAVNVGIQVCRGLEAAHAQGIVHRDLKPENVFWCDDGTIKLLDFGIALVAARQTRMTTTGIVLGTPWYLAPEQARGDKVLDMRVDVWGLGAVLYEALAGRAPFDREGALATVLAIVREELEPLAQAAPEVPEPLAAVLDRCLTKDPDMRWQSAAALREAFEQLDLSEAEPTRAGRRKARPTIAAGEQRVVAVLLAEGTEDPGTLERAVRHWGGTYLPLFGKRAVGLFGGAATEGDEVDRAALAALAAQDSAQHIAVAAGRAANQGAEISGGALMAAEKGIGAGLQGIAVDAAAARALSDRFALEPAQNEVFLLLSRRPSTPIPPPMVPTERTAAVSENAGPRPEALPLFGRNAELAQMEDTARAFLEEQQAHAMVVQGPPGIGKARLRREMVRLVTEAEPGTQVLLARADPVGASSALSLLAAALRRRARTGAVDEGWPSIEPQAPLERRQQAVERLTRLGLEDETLAQESMPFLGELLEVDMPESAELAAAREDPQLMADRLRIALRDWLEGLCAQGPVALFVENLQWADAASLEVLEEMVERLADYPFLLFATTRPWMRENRPDLLADRDVVWLEPRGLSGRDVAGLVRHLSGREPPDRLVRALRERTDGNPLFIEQIVLELVEQGTLSDSIEGRPLPVTVEAAIQSRLDHLPHLEKTLCKRAAVLGRPFSAEEVEALGTGDARSLLDSLRSRGFIAARSASRVGKDREYRFRNALVAEVAYNMLADEVRADLHRRAAVALARSTDATDEEIALHHERGGEPEQAATRYAAATRTAARTCDSETVLRCSERALELGVADEDRYELHMARADALHFRGRFEEQGTEIDGALKYAPDEVGRARALTERIIGLWRAGKVDDALEVAEQAAARAEETGDPEVLALALGRRAVLLVHRGELTEAGRMLSRATETAAKTRPWIRALMSAYRAQLVGVEGNLAARRASYGEALGQFDAVGDIRRAALNEINLADTLNRFGSYEQAESALRNAAAKCHRAAHRVGEGYAMANLGYSLLMLGRVEQALRTLEQAAAIARSTETAHLRVMVAVYKARARLDDPEATTQVVAEAKEAALETERIRLPGYRIVALTVAARAYLSAGATDKALDKAREAFEQLEELGSVEEDEAEVFLTYADSLEAAGEREQAEHIRQRGRTRLEELASEIEDERWRQQFLTQVPAHRKLLETGST